MNEEKVAAYVASIEKQGLPPVVQKNLLVNPGLAVDGRPPVDPTDKGDRGQESQNEFSMAELLKTSANVDNFALTPRGQEVLKALSEGTDSAGGFLTPPGFLAKIIERKQQLITLDPMVTHVPVTTDTGYIPTLATDISVVLGSENTEKTETTPVFGEATWQLYKFVAITKMSLELLEDSAINLESFLAEKFAEALARKQDEMIAMGTGSSMPTGLYYCSGVTAVSGIGALTYEDLLTIEHTVDARYRHQKGMAWVMNNTNVLRIRKLKDTAGHYIFVRGGLAMGVNTGERGIGDTLLGYPLLENPNLPDGAILFGELSYYWKYTRGGVRISATKEGGDSFAYDQLWIKCTERYDGNCVLAAAFAKGTGITS